MESNEQDNRQMTVIAAEIERQKTILKGIQENHDSLSGDIAANKVKHTISVLESLLPKEKEQTLVYGRGLLEDFLGPVDGAEYVGAALDFYNETFKTETEGTEL